MQTLSVKRFLAAVNDILIASFPGGSFEVEGEVSGFGYSGSEWVHFSLKEDNEVLNCFLKRENLREQIADGMKIAVVGPPAVSTRFSKFSVFVWSMRLVGEGSLQKAFQLLQKKLAGEGLFALERKRELPRFPNRVALITSREAAAYTDFLRVARARWPAAELCHFHVGVQGEGAVAEVCAALREAGNQPEEFDVIVLTRGGGSLEDLHVFNTEEVARAIFGSRVPVISAIGHERDVTIADMVADVRAATPSNAAELLFPDQREIKVAINQAVNNQTQLFLLNLARRRARVVNNANAIDRWLVSLRTAVERSAQRLGLARNAFGERISYLKKSVMQMQRLLESLQPQAILRRGFSYTKGASGRIIKSARDLHAGEKVQQVYYDGDVPMVVE